MMRAIPTNDTLQGLEKRSDTANNTNDVLVGRIDARNGITNRGRTHRPLESRKAKPAKTRLGEVLRMLDDDSDGEYELWVASLNLPHKRKDPPGINLRCVADRQIFCCQSRQHQQFHQEHSAREPNRCKLSRDGWHNTRSRRLSAPADDKPGQISSTIILYKHYSHANLHIYIFCCKQQQFEKLLPSDHRYIR